MENVDYISLWELSKNLFDKDPECLGVIHSSFDDFYGDIKKRYKSVLDILGLPKDIYKQEGKKGNVIPLCIKIPLIFYLCKLKEEDLLKNKSIRKDSKKSQDIKNYKLLLQELKLDPNLENTRDEKIQRNLVENLESIKSKIIKDEGLEKTNLNISIEDIKIKIKEEIENYKENYYELINNNNLIKPFIKFCQETVVLTEEEKQYALKRLNNSEEFYYEKLLEIKMDSLYLKIREMQDKMFEKDYRFHKIIYFPQFCILVEEYFKRIESEIDKIISELYYTRDIIDGDNWEEFFMEETESDGFTEENINTLKKIAYNAVEEAKEILVQERDRDISKEKISEEKNKEVKDFIYSLINK
nr:hypothetical protein [Clostridioides sp.]